jgi:putative mRNA 3-end processing factor
MSLIINTRYGLYCPPADIYIDPIRSVENAVLTHAHSDHARRGSKKYLAHHDSAPLLKIRLGTINLQTIGYNQQINIKGVKLSFHPAGHIIGSAQVRIEYNNSVWVVSGDYKIQPDLITTAFEPVKCDCFITETTFALPIFKWPAEAEVAEQINRWWQLNRQRQIRSVILGYSLGKAQRLASLIDLTAGQVLLHPSIFEIHEALRAYGIKLPYIPKLDSDTVVEKTALILAPPGVNNTDWLYQRAPYATGYASGWMQLNKMRKISGIDQGFIISDHVDWPGIEAAVAATEAKQIFVTHGYEQEYAQWLTAKGFYAKSIHHD